MASIGNILMDVTLPVVAMVGLEWSSNLDAWQLDQQGDAGRIGFTTH